MRIFGEFLGHFSRLFGRFFDHRWFDVIQARKQIFHPIVVIVLIKHDALFTEMTYLAYRLTDQIHMRAVDG